jgi:hypothetical protein
MLALRETTLPLAKEPALSQFRNSISCKRAGGEISMRSVSELCVNEVDCAGPKASCSMLALVVQSTITLVLSQYVL